MKLSNSERIIHISGNSQSTKKDRPHFENDRIMAILRLQFHENME